MAVDRNNRFTNILHLGQHGQDHLFVFVRRGVADRIGHVDRSGPGFNRGLDYLAEEVQVRAGGVLGRELDILAQAAGVADHLAGLGQGFLAGHPKEMFKMNIR